MSRSAAGAGTVGHPGSAQGCGAQQQKKSSSQLGRGCVSEFLIPGCGSHRPPKPRLSERSTTALAPILYLLLIPGCFCPSQRSSQKSEEFPLPEVSSTQPSMLLSSSMGKNSASRGKKRKENSTPSTAQFPHISSSHPV